MSLRRKLLVAALALAAIAFAAQGVAGGVEPEGLLAWCGFSLVLVVVAFVTLRREVTGSIPTVAYGPLGKYGTAAFALSFATYFGGSTLLLPVIGFAGFEFVGTPWFPLLFGGLAAIYYPLSKRWIQ
jgi:hypothetical protein